MDPKRRAAQLRCPTGEEGREVDKGCMSRMGIASYGFRLYGPDDVVPLLEEAGLQLVDKQEELEVLAGEASAGSERLLHVMLAEAVTFPKEV